MVRRLYTHTYIYIERERYRYSSPHHCVGFLFFAWIPPLSSVRRRAASLITHSLTHLLHRASALPFCVAGAVHRASWRSLRRGGRRWPAAAFCLAGSRTQTQSLAWQAQYTELHCSSQILTAPLLTGPLLITTHHIPTHHIPTHHSSTCHTSLLTAPLSHHNFSSHVITTYPITGPLLTPLLTPHLSHQNSSQLHFSHLTSQVHFSHLTSHLPEVHIKILHT